MGATARNHISQLPRPTMEGDLIPAVFLDPASGVCVVEPEEISRLSRLAHVIVFVPRTARIQGNHSGGRSAGLARVDKESTAQFLQTFFTGSEQIDRPNRESEVVFGEVTVNFPEMLAYRGSKPIPMTNMEFKMLKYLIQNARRVISRDELLNEVWGYENYPCTRTVDNRILRLRQKLEREPSRPVHFQTVHGAVSLRLTSIPVASSKKRWSARTKA